MTLKKPMAARGEHLGGDLLANLVVAFASVLATHWLFAPGHPLHGMFINMVLGMAIGMAVAEVLAVAFFMRWFGDAEIMLSVMVTGMVVGMFVSMGRTMHATSLGLNLMAAGPLAILCLAYVWLLDTLLHGDRSAGWAATAAGRRRRMRAQRDRYAPYWDAVRGEGPLKRWRSAKSRMFSAMGDGAVLLANAGTGADFTCLPTGRHLIATDISEAMLEQARPRARRYEGRIDLRAADPGALPFAAGGFDQVFMVLALSWLPDPESAVAELARVLKPGGRLYLFEQGQSRFFPFNVMQFVMSLLYRPFGICLIHRPERMLRSAGLTVTRCENIFLDVIRVIEAEKSLSTGPTTRDQ